MQKKWRLPGKTEKWWHIVPAILHPRFLFVAQYLFFDLCRQYHYLLLIELLKTIVMKCKMWVICNRVMNMLFWSIYGCDFRCIMVEMVNKYSMRHLLLADWRADNVMSFSLTASTMRFCIWIYLNTYTRKYFWKYSTVYLYI